MRFDLVDLRLILTVAEHGSLTRTAQIMHLALASISQRVAGMEAILGTPLLERTRQGVRTTPAGDALVRHARVIIAQVEQMHGELQAFGAGLKGRIKLLTNTGALTGFLPEHLGRFLAINPGLSIDIDERPSVEIVQAVADGRADMGVVADTTDLADLHTHPLADDQLVVIAGASSHLAEQPRIAFSAIVGDAFVGLKDAALESYLAEHASRLGSRINYRLQLKSVADLCALVAAGVGIAIVSKTCIAALSDRNVVIVPLSDTWASRQLCLCFRSLPSLTPQAQALAHHLISIASVVTLPDTAH